jgi:poly-gamma-glutamate capsule biosynthesis protein CapA/YwtB (metallophosphatase superfamily)
MPDPSMSGFAATNVAEVRQEPSLRLAAVGDIAFEGAEADRPTLDCLAGVRDVLATADLVVGNLECPLVDDAAPIPGKCTMRGARAWAGVLRQAGIGVVSLANNHSMDHGEAGLFSTIDALERAGIAHVGAGKNRAEACAPRFVSVRGKRVGFLARSAVIVTSRAYAEEGSPGVAFLDMAETCSAIADCRKHCDLVILLVHWGIEEYLHPSPSQRRDARRFATAGADAVIGHHPHVIQGAEYVGSCAVLYSLGNFVFSEFEWTYQTPEGAEIAQVSRLSRENRRALMASVDWSAEARPRLSYAFARIEDRGRLKLEEDPASERLIGKLSASLNRPWYAARWRLYALRKEWELRGGPGDSMAGVLGRLHRLRPRHVGEALAALRRSLRIVSGKSTNPYE